MLLSIKHFKSRGQKRHRRKILAKDSQALWVALHRSLAHNMDYYLSLCYPSDIFPAVEYLDKFLWGGMSLYWLLASKCQGKNRFSDLHFFWTYQWTLSTLKSKSFQEISVRPEHSKACGAPCFSRSQELAQNMELVRPSFKGRINRSPPSSARSWTAHWQLVQQWQRTAEDMHLQSSVKS